MAGGPNVGLVDAHAEPLGGDEYNIPVFNKRFCLTATNIIPGRSGPSFWFAPVVADACNQPTPSSLILQELLNRDEAELASPVGNEHDHRRRPRTTRRKHFLRFLSQLFRDEVEEDVGEPFSPILRLTSVNTEVKVGAVLTGGRLKGSRV